MALDSITPTDQKRFIDPYQQKVFKFDSVDSRYFLSRVNNSLTKAVGDDIILTGLKVTNITVSGAYNTIINATISPGYAIIDSTLVYIPQENIISFDTQNYSDTGKVVISLNYKYIETLTDNPVKINSSYITLDGHIVNNNGGWTERDRIIIDVIEFAKDGNNNIIDTNLMYDRVLTIIDSNTGASKTYTKKGWDSSNFNMNDFMTYFVSDINPEFGDAKSIHTRPIASTEPNDGEVLTWVSIDNQWEPKPVLSSVKIIDYQYAPFGPSVDLNTYGSSKDDVVINSALSNISSENRTLLFFPVNGDWSINNDVTIPSNIQSKFVNGSILRIYNNSGLTIRGSIDAGSYQIFGIDSGNILIDNNQDVYASWFGIASDGITNDATQFQHAIDSVITNNESTIIIDRPIYLNSDVTINNKNITLKFINDGKLVLNYGAVLTINCKISAEIKQIFDIVNGNIQGSINIEKLYPEWFGAFGDGVGDDTYPIQYCLNLGSVTQLLDKEYRITNTLYLNNNNVVLQGVSQDSTKIIYDNTTSVGSIISANINTHIAGLYTYINNCRVENLTLFSTSATVGLDITGFSHSIFSNLKISITGNNKRLIYGCCHNGNSPYYNTLSNILLIGDNSTTSGTSGSIGICFDPGDLDSVFNGPKYNEITNIVNSSYLDYFVHIKSGNDNLFLNLSSESIQVAHYSLNNVPFEESGTATSGTSNTLQDSAKSWTTGQFKDYCVKITGGTGAGQERRIVNNDATSLTIDSLWTVVPDGTSTYELYPNRCFKNIFTNLRSNGEDSADFIQSFPGAYNNSFSQYNISNITTGKIVNDTSVHPSNKYINGDIVLLQFSIENADASLTDYTLNPLIGGALYQGGVRLPYNYVIEQIRVSTTGVATGSATIKVNAGTQYTKECYLDSTNFIYQSYSTGNISTVVDPDVHPVSCTITTSVDWTQTSVYVLVYCRVLSM